MTTYVLLTRLSPETVHEPSEVRPLEKRVEQRIREECPAVHWLGNYAVLGPWDYLDLFEAPDEATAAKVALLVRSLGHAQTELWTAMPWKRFAESVAA